MLVREEASEGSYAAGLFHESIHVCTQSGLWQLKHQMCVLTIQ